MARNLPPAPASVAPSPAPEVPAMATGTRQGTSRQAVAPAHTQRILVAEDDPDLGPVLEEVLEEDGYEVLRTTDGAEAIRLAEQHTFDLILLDVEMPTLDGLAACRGLRADPRLETVPIIMLTARSGEEDMAEGFAQGATDYLTKPFAIAQFRARVRSWLTRTPGT